MRFFVRNLVTKLLLLGLLAVPLVLYGLHEGKALVEAGVADERKSPPTTDSEAQMKLAQEEAARLAALPSDLRKELLFPGGRPTNDASEPFVELGKAIRNRASILAAHRVFLLQFNATTLSGDTSLKFDVVFAAGLGKDLTTRYAKLWDDRREQLITQTKLSDLRNQLDKADAKALPELANEINRTVDVYVKRWGDKNQQLKTLCDQLLKKQLEVARAGTDEECVRIEAEWKRLMQLPAPDGIKATQTRIDGLLRNLRALEKEAKAQNDTDCSKWATDMLTRWTGRRDFLPEALTLLESLEKMLAEARVEDFFAACKKLLAAFPTDESRGLVRGSLEEFCTRFLVKQPKDPVKYDDFVILVGHDKNQHDVPRKQVKVYFKNDERRFMADGDPLKNDGFTEFHAERMKDEIRHLTVFDATLKDPLPGGLLTQIKFTEAQLKPTPKSAAVRFYCDEYRKVDRWNNAAIAEFVKKCDPHKDHLGEIWTRLSTINKAMSGVRELLGTEPKS